MVFGGNFHRIILETQIFWDKWLLPSKARLICLFNSKSLRALSMGSLSLWVLSLWLGALSGISLWFSLWLSCRIIGRLQSVTSGRGNSNRLIKLPNTPKPTKFKTACCLLIRKEAGNCQVTLHVNYMSLIQFLRANTIPHVACLHIVMMQTQDWVMRKGCEAGKWARPMINCVCSSDIFWLSLHSEWCCLSSQIKLFPDNQLISISLNTSKGPTPMNLQHNLSA